MTVANGISSFARVLTSSISNILFNFMWLYRKLLEIIRGEVEYLFICYNALSRFRAPRIVRVPQVARSHRGVKQRGRLYLVVCVCFFFFSEVVPPLSREIIFPTRNHD